MFINNIIIYLGTYFTDNLDNKITKYNSDNINLSIQIFGRLIIKY